MQKKFFREMEKFSEMVTENGGMDLFLNKVKRFIELNGFDLIDAQQKGISEYP